MAIADIFTRPAPVSAQPAGKSAGTTTAKAPTPPRGTARFGARPHIVGEGMTALIEWGEEYLARRMRQLSSGELRVAVHHADLLAHPS